MTQPLFRALLTLTVALAAALALPATVAADSGATGALARPWIGVVLGESDAQAGVAVDMVLRRSPAHAAGLQDGDRILSVNGEPVRTTGKLQTILRGQPIGRQVALEVQRGDETFQASMPLRAAPSSSDLLRLHLEGFPAPELSSLRDLDGEPVDASADGERPLVLDFWATWCGVCRQVNRRLQEALEESPDSFRVISITSEEPRVVRDHLQTRPRRLPVAIDTDSAAHDALLVSTYPLVIVISPDGEVTHVVTGLQQVEALLPSLTPSGADSDD